MADENTTASTATTEATDQTAASATTTSPSDTSTTEASKDEAPAKTLLTDTPADDKADSAADGAGEKDGEGETEETSELFGAPEGNYQLELPEGVEVDAKALEAVAPVAKELGLSNKGLSKIAGVYQETVLPQVIEGLNAELERSIADTHRQWAEQATELVKTDPIFKAAPLHEVQQIAAKAIDRFGGEELRKFYDETGSGNHPAMLRFAYLVGSALSEDTTFERGSQANKPKSTVDKFYGADQS